MISKVVFAPHRTPEDAPPKMTVALLISEIP